MFVGEVRLVQLVEAFVKLAVESSVGLSPWAELVKSWIKCNSRHRLDRVIVERTAGSGFRSLLMLVCVV